MQEKDEHCAELYEHESVLRRFEIEQIVQLNVKGPKHAQLDNLEIGTSLNLLF